MRPWRCRRIMRSSRRRPSSMPRYSRFSSAAGMWGSRDESRLPSLSRIDRCSTWNLGSRTVRGMGRLRDKAIVPLAFEDGTRRDGMAFIRTISPAEAEGPVREMYQQAQGGLGYVPNWAQAFSLRPGVRDGWIALLKSIRASLPERTYELATLAAARALRSSYCSLAHGRVLADKVFDAPTVTAIARDARESPLEPRERAMMAFAEKVAVQADRITAADVE